MSYQIVTQYGPLGRCTALAVQLVISRTANNAVVALTTVHLQLGLRPGERLLVPPSRNPTDRWHRLLVWLFGSLPVAEADDLGDYGCPSATPEEERTVDKILGAAGSFLMSECAALSDQIDTWLAVEPSDTATPASADEVAAMRDRLLDAGAAGQTLLRHVGRGNWLEVLQPRAEAAVPEVPSEDEPAMTWHGYLPAPRVKLVYKGREPLDQSQRIQLETAVTDAFVDLINARSQVAIVVDELADVGACLPAVRELLRRRMNEVRAKVRQLAIVVTAVDGRQSSPIVFPIGQSVELCDHVDRVLIEAIEDAARPARPQPFGLSPFNRLEGLASAMTFVANTADPHQIIVVSDLPAARPAEFGLPEPDEFLDELDEVEARPDLAGRSVCLVAPHETWAFNTYWSAVCAGAASRQWTVVGRESGSPDPVLAAAGQRDAGEAARLEPREVSDGQWVDEITVVLQRRTDARSCGPRAPRALVKTVRLLAYSSIGLFLASIAARVAEQVDLIVVLLALSVFLGFVVLAFLSRPLKSVVFRQLLIGLSNAAVSNARSLDLSPPPGAELLIASLDRRSENTPCHEPVRRSWERTPTR